MSKVPAIRGPSSKTTRTWLLVGGVVASSIVLARGRCASTPPEPTAPARSRGSESPPAEPLKLPVRVYNPALSRIAFAPDEHAALAIGTEGMVLRSVDDGRSWSRVDTGTSEQLMDAVVHPASRSILIAGSHGTLLRTQDAGESFSRVWIDTQAGFHAMAVSPVDGTIMAVGDDGVAYTSKNGGTSFTPENTGVTSYLAHVVATADQARFVVGGDLGLLMMRDEAGHWRSTPAPAKMLVTALAVLPDGSLVAGTQDGFVLRSADSGQKWTLSHKMPEDVFVHGFESNPSGSVLLGRVRSRHVLFSGDQGRSFEQLPFQPEQGLSRLVWLEGQGFVGLGLLGAVISSDPTGKHWFVRPDPALKNPASLAVHPVTQTLLAVGASGLIARSADQGRSFQVIRPGLGGILRSIAFHPANGCLVAVGLDATMVRSDRRGTEWSPVRLSVDPRVEWTQVVFEPETGAFIASGSNGTLLRSTDCGGSWTRTEATKAALTSLLVYGRGAVLALAASGPILRSTDGGRIFSPSQMDSDASLRRAVSTGGGSALVAVGNRGRIYRSRDEGRR
ncbi:MAG: hypothetical protein JW940_00005, partial [Polyangiaceae bacterium]|nr:hypothetical protein [Polyangiaceae bacterium]